MPHEKRWRVFRTDNGGVSFSCTGAGSKTCGNTILYVHKERQQFKLDLHQQKCINNELHGRCRKCGIRHDIIISEIADEPRLTPDEVEYIQSKIMQTE